MADVDLSGRKVLAIVTNYGVEQDELVVPLERLRASGATVDVAAQGEQDVQTLVDDKDPGRTVAVDRPIRQLEDSEDYDLLLLPGGTINADQLRLDDDALVIVKAFIAAGKPIAAICHAPWTLIETGAVSGRRLTSFWSLRTDVTNAGGDWHDEAVVVDDDGAFTLITSRNPDDLDAFVGAIDGVLAKVSA